MKPQRWYPDDQMIPEERADALASVLCEACGRRLGWDD